MEERNQTKNNTRGDEISFHDPRARFRTAVQGVATGRSRSSVTADETTTILSRPEKGNTRSPPGAPDWHAFCRARLGVALSIGRLSEMRTRETVAMSTSSTIQAHISYELLDQRQPNVVVIDFVSRTISDPSHAHEMGEQLDWLIRPELPLNYVIDLKNVRSLGSTAFGQLCAFARRVRWWGGKVRVCELHPSLQLGAALIGLERYAEFSSTRQAAIQEARKSARQREEEAVSNPVFWS